MSRNQFAGPCYRCGKRVEAGAGHFERVTLVTRKHPEKAAVVPPNTRWLLQHADCAIEHRGSDHTYKQRARAGATQ